VLNFQIVKEDIYNVAYSCCYLTSVENRPFLRRSAKYGLTQQDIDRFFLSSSLITNAVTAVAITALVYILFRSAVSILFVVDNFWILFKPM